MLARRERASQLRLFEMHNQASHLRAAKKGLNRGSASQRPFDDRGLAQVVGRFFGCSRGQSHEPRLHR
jgi:hypothetical protein